MPWLPEEWVATPFAACASFRPNTAFEAPRALNAPPFWRFSHLKKSSAPESSLMTREVRMGVRWM